MSSSSGSGVQQVLDIEVYQKSPASVVFSLLWECRLKDRKYQKFCV
jgi:hypothetical protein